MSDPSDVGLAPGLLVAAPSLGDPNFAGSVVLMAQHTAEGALGFVVNRPAPVAASEVLAAVDDALSAGRASASVLLGGPVTPERLWILYRSGIVAVEEDGLRIGGSLALGGSRNLLRALVREPAAGPFHMVLGCAGWGPMQVEREVTGGA